MENKPVLENIIEEDKELEVVENTEDSVSEPTQEAKIEESVPKKKRTRKVASKKTKETEPDKCEEVSKVKTWKEVFLANYNGESKEAKSLQPHLKETYKGDPYIPWAVMERLVYMCDPNAEFINVNNENGGLVHTDTVYKHQKNIQKGEVVSETEAPMFSHFVRVVLRFMGRTFVEDYPIQDQDYSAASIFNQNLVNRALQRAKAKVGARATGLGLKLYEGFDLQFDSKEDKKPSLPTSVKNEPAVPSKKEVKEEVVAPKVVNETNEQVETVSSETVSSETVSSEEVSDKVVSKTLAIKEVIDIIRNTDREKMIKILQRINVSVVKKCGFSLSVDDSDEELVKKLSKFTNVKQFGKTLKSLSA